MNTGRSRLSLGLVLVLGSLSVASPAVPQETPTFPARVELVRIDVVVVDHDGKPVTGLTAADFEVSEGGKPHEIVSFEPIVAHLERLAGSRERRRRRSGSTGSPRAPAPSAR